MLVGAVLLGLGLLSGTSSASSAPGRALLVGVSDYDLPTMPDLCCCPGDCERADCETRTDCGPRNDVVLMRSMLQERGVPPSRIRTLADGVEGAPRPTAAAIHEALRTIAEEAEAGEPVLLYLSGHGLQQPNQPDDTRDLEPNGQDQVLAAIDFDGWDAKRHTLRNVVVDDAIGAAIAGMLARGARVWLVVDSCHSGGASRAPDRPGVQYRTVDLKAVLSPEALVDFKHTRSSGRARASTWRAGIDLPDPMEQAKGSGALSAFYASNADEPAAQLGLPMDSTPRSVHGLLTFALTRALQAAPERTYADLAKAVTVTYDDLGFRWTHPLFEGNGLGAGVWEAGRTEPAREQGR
jgi:hypothetical protein